METISSKVIRSTEIDSITQWQPPTVKEPYREARSPDPEPAPVPTLPTAAELEEINKQAYEEGFAQGKKEGFEFAHNEGRVEARNRMQIHSRHFDALLTSLSTPFVRLDDQVEQELVTLVISMVRQLVRREIRTDPQQIVGVVREAMAILPVASRNVRLVLHPEDAEIIREIYTLSETDLGWRVVEDPVLARGGCKIITDSSQIDATLESRISTLIAPLLAGERSDDSSDEAISLPISR